MPTNSNAWSGTPIPNNARTRLGTEQKNFLMGALIRVPLLFEQAKSELKPESFDKITEINFSIIWRAALNLAEKNNGFLPTNVEQLKTLLELEAQVLAQNAPSNMLGISAADSLFSDETQQGLIDWIFSKDPVVFQEEYCRGLLKQLLEERILFDPLQRFVQNYGTSVVPTNIDSMLSDVRANRERIESMNTSPVQEVEIENWEGNTLAQMPSNVAFIDAATDGGPGLGEVITLLGPSGGGKTLLGIQLAVEGARYQVRQASTGMPSGYWYYFSYESPITPDIRQRVVSCASKISWSELKSIKSLSELSTSDNLKEYEKIRWKAKLEAGIPIPGEQERYRAAMGEIGNRLQLADMSGSISPSVGTRGIDEIVQVLNQGLAKGKQPVGIVIDYAGIVVERMMAAKNEKIESEFAYLNRFVNNVRVEIASRFNCVAWVLHQLHGDAAAASPSKRQHHSKARGARNFADNANFAFNIGTKDPTNNCCVITCTKHRRTDSIKDPPVVRIDGAVNMMVPVDGKYSLDASQLRIIDKETSNSVVDPSTTGSILRRPKNGPLSGAGKYSRDL